jgi:hypothetical protein
LPGVLPGAGVVRGLVQVSLLMVRGLVQVGVLMKRVLEHVLDLEKQQRAQKTYDE